MPNKCRIIDGLLRCGKFASLTKNFWIYCLIDNWFLYSRKRLLKLLDICYIGIRVLLIE